MVWSNAQSSFLGGEWSSYAQGRFDDPRYKTAMNVALNGFPVEEGAFARRSGFRHCAHTRNGGEARLLPFEFEDSTSYSCEYTDSKLRIFDGPALITDSVAAVSSFSSNSPAVVTLASAVDWESGSQAVFQFGTDASARAFSFLANRQFLLTKTDTTHFQLHDPVTRQPLNGADLASVSGYSLSLAKIMEFDTPYTDDLLPQLRCVQTQGRALLLTGTKAPRSLEVEQYPSLGQPATFTFDTAFLRDGPYLDPVEGSVITPSGTTGIINLTLSFTAYSSTKAYRDGDFVTDGGISYVSLQDQNVGNTPSSSPLFWEVTSPGTAVSPNGFQLTDIGRLIRLFSGGTSWTWGKIVAMSSTGQIQSSTGTAGGTFTNSANAFDGETTTQATKGQQLNTDVGQTSIFGIIGKDFTGNAQVIGTVVAYPDETNGFLSGAGSADLTIRLLASNVSLGSGTNVELDTVTLTPDQITPLTLTSSDQSNAYSFVWLEFSASAAPNQGTIFPLLAVDEIQMNTPSAAAGIAVEFQVLGDPLVNTSAISVWRLGVYSDTTGWPKNGCYHEGRLWLSGAVKNRIDGSKSNDVFNFEPTATTGTVADNNAISYTFNSAEVNPIYWMRPNAQGIICGTKKGEWLVQASAQNNPLTPTSIQAHIVTKYGCADIEPVEIGLSTVFVQTFKRRLLEFISDAYSGKFFAPNLNELAKHMTKSGVEEVVSQEELAPIVWARRSDGRLVGAIYRRVSMLSSEPPKFLGWHAHTLGSGRDTESLVIGANDSGDLDALYIVSNDPETGIRHVEVLNDLFDEENALTEARFLDNSITPVCAETVSISGKPGLRFSGLWHLNGKKVSVWACGIDCGDFIVTNGYVDVPYSGLFTAAEVIRLSTSGEDFGSLAVAVDGGAKTIPAVVGFTYTTRGQVLRPNAPLDVGTRAGPGFGKSRRVHEFAALLHKAQGVFFGTRFDKLRPANFKTPGGTAYANNRLFSGIWKDSVDDDNSTDGMLAWEIRRPYPCTVCAIGGFLETQDK